MTCLPPPPHSGRWCNMDVAVKTLLFQDVPTHVATKDDEEVRNIGLCNREVAVHEAAVCCSMSHPNVVATYHYEVLHARSFRKAPSGLSIVDRSGSKAFKLYLIQVD